MRLSNATSIKKRGFLARSRNCAKTLTGFWSESYDEVGDFIQAFWSKSSRSVLARISLRKQKARFAAPISLSFNEIVRLSNATSIQKEKHAAELCQNTSGFWSESYDEVGDFIQASDQNPVEVFWHGFLLLRKQKHEISRFAAPISLSFNEIVRLSNATSIQKWSLRADFAALMKSCVPKHFYWILIRKLRWSGWLHPSFLIKIQ